MPAFKDANGREWMVKIDAPKIREVRKVLDIDLGAPDGEAFSKLDSDPVLLVDVLWVLCRSQADGKTDVEFGEALIGEPLEHATKALTDAWLDFFPAGKRSLLRSLSEKQAAVQDKAIALALAKVNDPQLEAKFLEAMEAKLTRDMESALTQLNGATS